MPRLLPLAFPIALGALAPAAVPRRAAAQDAPAQGAAAPRVGALVRVGTLSQVVDPRLPPGAVAPELVTGRLVAADSAALTLRTRTGWALTVPRSQVRSLDERRGAGWCGTRARRLTCATVGLAAGAGLGYAALRGTVNTRGQRLPDVGPIGREGLSDEDRARRARRGRHGAAGGGALGIGVGLAVGYHRWRPAAGWPAGAP